MLQYLGKRAGCDSSLSSLLGDLQHAKVSIAGSQQIFQALGLASAWKLALRLQRVSYCKYT